MTYKIFATISFTDDSKEKQVSELVFDSICPDNEFMTELSSEKKNGTASISFSAEKIGTVLATADDILMNAEIALKVIENTK
ncbi:MAG: hypothetical protein GX362_00890 [Methanosarcinaceae archaeon]|nr:hypothetical protein [Methanosarcinaceae archaeon]